MKPYIQLSYDAVPIEWLTVPAGNCNETQIANDADCLCLLNFSETAGARIVATREMLASHGYGETEINDMVLERDYSITEYLYVIGGLGEFIPRVGPQIMGDVWRTPDGINWDQLVVDGGAPWGRRHSHGVIAFDGYLWIIAGHEAGADQYMADVWKSADGIEWTRATEEIAPGFAPRIRPYVYEYNNRIYVYGGMLESDAPVFDLWSSADGVTWVEEFTSNESELPGTLVEPFNPILRTRGKLYLVNGYLTTATPLLSSTELFGDITLEDAFAIPGYGMTNSGGYVTPDGGPAYLIGGLNTYFASTPSDVFPPVVFELNTEGDGFDLLTDEAPFPGRAFPNLVDLNGRILYIGGSDGEIDTGRNAEIWASEAGFPSDPDAWELIGTMPFGRRVTQMIVHLAELVPVICYCDCPPLLFSGPTGALTLKADSGQYAASVLKPGA